MLPWVNCDRIGYRFLLEHNLFKNVSNWVTFLWQTQIQTIKYVLNYAKRIRKKQVTLKLYSFTPSRPLIWCFAKSDLGKKFVTTIFLNRVKLKDLSRVRQYSTRTTQGSQRECEGKSAAISKFAFSLTNLSRSYIACTLG